MAGSKGKVCLATILAFLLEQIVVAFLGDVGQDEDFTEVEKKGKILLSTMIIADLKREFVEDLLWKAVGCNAIYEDQYLLGTSLARPVLAKAMMKAADEEGCDFVAHGCTGKGNDQVRFELAFYTINPTIKVIAPWRDPTFFNRFRGRNDLLDYAAEKGIPVTSTKAKPYSME
ncbi:hypothetical protein DL768_000374 [Monosporascus sp. mg162]|nr:hypothetical protein DL768_000374 [Monosporascus sp. mg162]